MTIPKAPQVFPRSEYLRRMAAVKAEMAKQGVETLVVINIKNITYLTGYTAKSAYVPQGVVVSASREEPAFILRQCDWPAALHQAWMSRDNIIMYPESLVGVTGKDGFDAVIDYLNDLGVANRQAGLELNDLNVNQMAKFKARALGARRQVRSRDRIDARGRGNCRRGGATYRRNHARRRAGGRRGR